MTLITYSPGGYWPQYWNNFIKVLSTNFFIPSTWYDFLQNELYNHNAKIIDYTNFSYDIEFNSEEDYFLFVIKWS